MDDHGLAMEGNLEVRQFGGARSLSGFFPYNKTAVRSDRGAVRKESFASRAFNYSIDDPAQPIDILIGHSWNRPVASRKAQSLEITDTTEGVLFEARLGDDPPSWVVDMEKSIANGTTTGLSPGFRVPPRTVVPDAEALIPEKGNPGISIRNIRQAVLREMSVVTAGSYLDAFVSLRSEELAGNAVLFVPRSIFQWL